jgi:hypothetical protein
MHGLLVACPDLTSDDVVGVSVVAGFPSLPIIFWDGMSHEGANLVSLLAKSANPRVHVNRYDDENVIEKFLLGCSPLREQLRYSAELEPCLLKLGSRTRAALVIGLDDYPVPNAVSVAAQRAGCKEREFRERVTTCGITDPKWIFWARKVIDAWAFARDPGFRPIDIAQKCGYARVESALDAVKKIDVNSLAELAALSSDELLERVVRVVIRKPLA